MLRRRDFLLSLFLSVLAFFPSLAARGTTGAFLFHPDSLAWYVPTLAKAHALLSRGQLVALDFTTYNGGTDFHAAPIFPTFDPLVLLYGLCTPASWASLDGLLAAFVVLCMAHVFIACYFTLKLLQGPLGTGFGTAAIGAALYAFGMPMAYGTLQLSFLVCASFLPWMTYALARHAQAPSLRSAIVAAPPVVFCLVGGYAPVAGFAAATGVVLAAAIVMSGEGTQRARVAALLRAMVPVGIALVVAAPLIYAIRDFHQDSLSAAAKTVEWAAYERSELPQSLVRMLSPNFTIVGPNFELTYYTGLPALLLGLMFLLVPGAARALTPLQHRVLWICAALYVLLVLATLGPYTVFSDLVFYYLPQVGKMHNYTRFLLPAQLLLAIPVALACQALIAVRPVRTAKVGLVLTVVAMFTLAWVLSAKPELAKAGLVNQYLVVEALLAALLCVGFLAPGRHTAAIVAFVVLAAPSFDRFYDFGLSRYTLASQREARPLVLDEKLHADFAAHLQRTFPGRDAFKYYDATGIWKTPGLEWFPKNFGGLVRERVRLTSMSGYPSHILARRDYARKIPLEGFGGFAPSWELLENAGVQFFVAAEEELRSGASGAYLADLYRRAKPESLFRMPNGLVAVPFDAIPGGALFEDAAFRVMPRTEAVAANLALRRPATQSSGNAAPASRAVDGNTNGDFAAQSVTHTDADPQAWLDIDLGEARAIDSVRIWNRTDCCGDRMKDYWIFLSPTPFARSDRVESLRQKAGVWGRPGAAPDPVARVHVGGFAARYVRVQIAGTGQDTYLSLAEVEVFAPRAAAAAGVVKVTASDFDFARRAALTFEAPSPTAVQYRYAPNKRLVFELDGARVASRMADELLTIDVPAGRHVVEVRYSHPALVLFWFLYAVLLVAAVAAAAIPWRRSRLTS